MKQTADIVICGAGIAGISTAYFLAVHHNIKKIVLVDERDPLSLTSDKSTECYRNWWPGPGSAMVELMNRSIDLLEILADQSGNIFQLNRRGYLYLTSRSETLPQFIASAREPERLGAGELRIYTGAENDPTYIPGSPHAYHGTPEGADLFLDPALIHKYFPYLHEGIVAALHVRRAGWFSAQQLGMYLLEQCRHHGVQLIRDEITGIDVQSNAVTKIILGSGMDIDTPVFVDAAGPYLNRVAGLMRLNLPIFSELHLKVAFKDTHRVIPRQAPLLIWTDPQYLKWSDEERLFLQEEQNMSWLLEEMPAGAHTRPEGGVESDIVLMLWEYHQHKMEPIFPPPLDQLYPEIALRGLAAIFPDLRLYFDKIPRPILDGGYYTKTSENRPLIGATPVEGAFVVGALSGYGLMAGCGAGELAAAHITRSSSLPAYAPYFALSRYSNPEYLSLFADKSETGQL